MKIAIIGLGLIGGSLGLDLKKQGIEILGISRSQTTCEKAQEMGVIDEFIALEKKDDCDLNRLRTTEIIFLCTPIDRITTTLQEIKPYLDDRTIVTDVGSVKKSIVTKCTKLWTNFIGGHPMAGTAEQGIEAAQFNLFQGAAYVLTPSKNTPKETVSKIQKIAELLQSKVYICSPEIHDRAVALISHLPVMVSAALIEACMSETETDTLKLAQQLASSGFRDTSRVGGGNPELGLMMAQFNRQELLRSLKKYRHNLDKIIKQIDKKDWQKLENILTSDRKARKLFVD